MKLVTRKSCLRGPVKIPGSKSHTIRSVALAALAEGMSEIHEPLVSADTDAVVNCYRQLGAEISCGKSWSVKGTGGQLQEPGGIINVANSGTTLRIALGSASLLKKGKATFDGDVQTRSRPIGPLLDSLNDLGASCRSIAGDGRAPVEIAGPLKGGSTRIEAVTSQYLSSLLFCAPKGIDPGPKIGAGGQADFVDFSRLSPDVPRRRVQARGLGEVLPAFNLSIPAQQKLPQAEIAMSSRDITGRNRSTCICLISRKGMVAI